MLSLMMKLDGVLEDENVLVSVIIQEFEIIGRMINLKIIELDCF